MTQTRVVALNAQGLRIGEDHPRAKMSNHDVDLLLELRAEGWSYMMLADKFEISKSQARNIAVGRKRCQYAVRFMTIFVDE